MTKTVLAWACGVCQRLREYNPKDAFTYYRRTAPTCAANPAHGLLTLWRFDGAKRVPLGAERPLR